MRIEIRELQRRLGITTLYVTHDQAEALAISDRIVVMNGGRIEQVGDPDTIYRVAAQQLRRRFPRRRKHRGGHEPSAAALVETPVGRFAVAERRRSERARSS